MPDATLGRFDREGRIPDLQSSGAGQFGYSEAEVGGKGRTAFSCRSRYRVEHDGYMDPYMRTGERRIIGIDRVVVGQRPRRLGPFPMKLAVGEMKSRPTRYSSPASIRDLTERAQPKRGLEEVQYELARLARINELGEYGLDAGT